MSCQWPSRSFTYMFVRRAPYGMKDALMPLACRLYFLNGSPENGGYGLFDAETMPEAARSSVAANESIFIVCSLPYVEELLNNTRWPEFKDLHRYESHSNKK